MGPNRPCEGTIEKDEMKEVKKMSQGIDSELAKPREADLLLHATCPGPPVPWLLVVRGTTLRARSMTAQNLRLWVTNCYFYYMLYSVALQ